MTFQKVVKAFYHLGLSEKEIAKLTSEIAGKDKLIKDLGNKLKAK